MQDIESSSFHDRRFLLSFLFKAAVQSAPIFSRETFPEIPCDLCTCNFSRRRTFRNLSVRRRENFSECMRCTVFFAIALILASLLRAPHSPQFGAQVETHGQKGSQIRARDAELICSNHTANLWGLVLGCTEAEFLQRSKKI